MRAELERLKRIGVEYIVVRLGEANRAQRAAYATYFPEPPHFADKLVQVYTVTKLLSGTPSLRRRVSIGNRARVASSGSATERHPGVAAESVGAPSSEPGAELAGRHAKLFESRHDERVQRIDESRVRHVRRRNSVERPRCAVMRVVGALLAPDPEVQESHRQEPAPNLGACLCVSPSEAR